MTRRADGTPEADPGTIEDRDAAIAGSRGARPRRGSTTPGLPALSGSGGGGGGGKGGGKGGGGGGGATPTESPDNLRSRATARIVELISEGEIGGLVNGAQSIYFGETPLMDQDGSLNFQGVTWVQQTGTPDQDPLPNFPAVEREVVVNTEVRHSNEDPQDPQSPVETPVIRTITDPDLDAVRVTIRIPQLSQITGNGSLVGSTVSFKIDVRPTGSDWTPAIVNRVWQSFGAQTDDHTTGVEVTATTQTEGGSRTGSFSLRAEYREVGTTDWLLLGEDAGTVNNSVVRRTIWEERFGGKAISFTSRIVTEFAATSVSRTFVKDDLAAGIYEVRATLGSISSKRAFSPADITISGKTTSGYEQAYRVALEKGAAPWDVRITRITADSTSAKLQNRLIWQSYTEIIDEKLIYPDSALIGLAVDSEAFGSNIPQRAFDVKGVIVEVPSNYHPEGPPITNLLPRSEQFDQWSDPTPGPVIVDTAAAPDGAMSADTIDDADDTATVEISQTVTVPNDSLERTFSIHIQKGTVANRIAEIQLRYDTGGTEVEAAAQIDVQSGTTALRLGSPDASVTATSVNDFWRLALTFPNNNSGNTSLTATIVPAVATTLGGAPDATATGSIVAWGAQLEDGPDANIYVRTDDTSKTLPDHTRPRLYEGIWDGTFKRAWSDNPAWCLRDLLINDRYGIGVAEADVDKWALFQIAKYCDELVPDGFGGFEPRFVLNAVLQTREEAYAVINSIASVFRGIVYWASGAVTVGQDSPSDPEVLVTPANVIGGEFTYSGTALKARHTAALVQWNDPDDSFRPSVEMLEDAGAIFKHGYRPAEVVAFGTTSRGQAHRLGKWLLDTEQTATETVTYQAGFDHADLAPGKIISVADPDHAGVRMGGRIKAATTTSVTTDAQVTIADGQTYSLSVVLSDQSVASASVTNAPGETDTLTLGETLSEAPQVGAIWVLTASQVEPRQFRVLSNAEVKPNVFEITALLHDPGKFDRVEQDMALDPPDTSVFPRGALASPTELTITEFLFKQGSQIASAATISWAAAQDTRVRFYQVDVLRPGEGSWEHIGDTSTLSIDFRDTTADSYGFRVRSADGFGRTSAATTVEGFPLTGLSSPPPDVTNLVSVVRSGQTVLIWDPVEDVRGVRYGIRKGTTYSTAQRLGETTERLFPTSGDGTYWVTALAGDGASANPAQIVIEGASVFGNVVAEFDEGALGWTGDLTSGGVVQAGHVKLAGTGSILDAPVMADIPNIIFMGDIAESATYTIPDAHVVDLGESQPSAVTVDIDLRGDVPTIDIRDEPDIRALASMRGDYGDFVSAKIEIRTAGDDEIWTPWRLFAPGEYAARKYDMRVTISSTDRSITAVLEKFILCIDMPDRIDRRTAIQIPAVGTSVTYQPAFRIVPNLQVTIISAQNGDDVVLTNQSATGFDVRVLNAGNGVARQVNYLAQGY